MTTRLKTAPLPALPIPVKLSQGFTESQLIQFADRVRTIALLQAANACMKRIPHRMILAREIGHTPLDAESLACAKAIHDLIDPQDLTDESLDQIDMFAAQAQRA